MTDILKSSDDPNHPRNRARWHAVPRRLYWLCIILSPLAFGMETRTWITCLDPFRVRADYDFCYFRLIETESGEWFFKAG